MSTGANENSSLTPEETISTHQLPSDHSAIELPSESSSANFSGIHPGLTPEELHASAGTSYHENPPHPADASPVGDETSATHSPEYSYSHNYTDPSSASYYYNQSYNYSDGSYSGYDNSYYNSYYYNYPGNYQTSETYPHYDSNYATALSSSDNSAHVSTSDLLHPDKKSTQQKPPPKTGLKKKIYTLTGGKINLGRSKKDLYHDRLDKVISRSLAKPHKIALFSFKGGVGKTTTAIVLGDIFASLRNDRAIALDTNPVFGTLSERIKVETQANIRDLLNDPNIEDYFSVRTYTSTNPSKLEILSSERDPENAIKLTSTDYAKTLDILTQYYSLIVTDCGTDVTSTTTREVLNAADSLIIVTTPTLDSAKSALHAIDYLENHGYESLIRKAIIVICSVNFAKTSINVDEMKVQFLKKVAAVFELPYDRHLAEGEHISLEHIAPSAIIKYKELAALIAEKFE